MSDSRILVVEDTHSNRYVLCQFLLRAGHRPVEAQSAAEAITLLGSSTFDMLITDLMMPGMDGFAVLKELRKKSDVPVLMLTALGDEADRIVGLEIGADDYLPKTFSSRELLARLRAVTGPRTTARSSTVATVAPSPVSKPGPWPVSSHG
jgi:two-component system response regulator CpxR